MGTGLPGDDTNALKFGHTRIVDKGRLWVKWIVLKNIIYL